MDSYEKSKSGTKRYKKVKKLLKEKFGYDNFRELQYKIINAILNEEDVTAVLPTGYGKSLCFQLPAVYTGEPAVVISPLIALMEDQRMLMEKIGIKTCCYNSTVSNKEKLEYEILTGMYSIIYITPESVINCSDMLNKLYESYGISMFAIDEAHCISAYGFEFRTAYRALDKLRIICEGVPILAVTATATTEVINDINKVMSMKGIVVKTSFDRPNLTLHINRKDTGTKKEIVSRIKNADGSHIIYCVTKKDTEELCSSLRKSGLKVGMYHAGMKNKERKETQEKFMNGDYTTIVATIAFGMGINKSDVRTVVHYGCPKNLESYYQEIGRAGRDGKPSDCYLYYSTKDFIIQQRFVNDITDQAYRAVRERLLDIMIKFVNTDQCRKKIILEYFGDMSSDGKCNKCDNCLNAVTKEEAKCDDDKTIKKYGNDMYRLLSVLKDVNCNFGAVVVIGIIRGSKSKKIPDRYYKNKFYNTGKSSNDKWWKDLMDNLNDSGYIEQHSVSQMIYVPKITKKGIKFLDTYDFKESMDVAMEIDF